MATGLFCRPSEANAATGRSRRRLLVLTAALVLTACNPEQSALHPAGEDAADIARLFWVMLVGAVAIWCVVIGAAVFATLAKRTYSSERAGDWVILGGGIVFPTVTLAALLVYGLPLLPDWGPDDPADVVVEVAAEQYWWRVTYLLPDGKRVETANEMVVPEGGTVEVRLTSPDVIHSFWIPPLGGKMDAIPGRQTVIRLRPTLTGSYRGICAEFCGDGHAFMAFEAHVLSQADFQARIEAEAAPASGNDPQAFLAAGCDACHRIRGLVDGSRLGPDLTHFAARGTVAGILEMTTENLRAWLESPQTFKPDARMPGYAMLEPAELDRIVAFLEGLGQ